MCLDVHACLYTCTCTMDEHVDAIYQHVVLRHVPSSWAQHQHWQWIYSTNIWKTRFTRCAILWWQSRKPRNMHTLIRFWKDIVAAHLEIFREPHRRRYTSPATGCATSDSVHRQNQSVNRGRGHMVDTTSDYKWCAKSTSSNMVTVWCMDDSHTGLYHYNDDNYQIYTHAQHVKCAITITASNHAQPRCDV